MNSIKTLSTTMADVPHSTKRKRTRKDINVSGINTSHHGSNSQMKWTIDATVGGKFGRRTIFSKDEKYIFTTTERSVKVINAATGQIARSFGWTQDHQSKITDFLCDPSNDFRIITVSSDEKLRVFDWSDGLLISQARLSIGVPKQLLAFGASMLVATSTSVHLIPFLQFQDTSQECPPDFRSLPNFVPASSTIGPIATDSSLLICVATDNILHIGWERKQTSAPEDPDLCWRTMTVQTTITAVSCTQNVVALGEHSGEIHIYFDVLRAFNKKQAPIGTVVRWHHSPVASLSLSQNGLYVLSGAEEDVLLVYQTSSGQKHYVPRLGARVIDVSQPRSSTKYLLNLSNNRLKIIDAATFELQAEITGLHCPAQSKSDTLTVGCLHPSKPLFFLGSASPDDPATLQCYDFDHDQELSCLEIASTKRINSTGLENRIVRDAKLSLAALSRDGLHLATVDEWYYDYEVDGVGDREINLKFWTWREKSWTLTTKVENPHGLHQRVLSLTSATLPSHYQEFATFGSDGSVKIWRSGDDLTRGKSAWTLFRTKGISIGYPQRNGVLKYSRDNTTLIISVDETVYVLDTTSNQVQFSIHVGQRITALDTLSKYVLCLLDDSSLLSIWDLSNGSHVLSEPLDRPHSIMAVNHPTTTIALASSSPESEARIVISKLSGTENIKIASFSIAADIRCLLGSESTGNVRFMFIDGSGHVGRIIEQEGSKLVGQDNSAQDIINFSSTPLSRDLNRSTFESPGLSSSRWTDHNLSHVLENSQLSTKEMYEIVVGSLS